MYPTLLSFLYFSLSKQQSTHQCYILAVHPVTESVPVRGDCRGLAKKNQGRQRTSDFSRCDLSRCKNETHGRIWKCAQGRLFNRGDWRIAVCSIARATRLSLDYRLYKWNTQ